MFQAMTTMLLAFIAVTNCAPARDNLPAMSKILEANKKVNELDIIYGDIKHHGDRQNALMGKAFRWPNNIMHYTFKTNEFSSANEAKIRRAMKTLSEKTCIEFKEHTYGNAPTAHVEFIDGSGCWSYIGIQGDTQQLSLHSGYCMSVGTITHEILHALGVDHEQARKDRDKYIRVLLENVESGQEINFQKEDTNSLGVEYDPFSVMQYGNYDWSKNGEATLEWIADPSLSLGGDNLSELDILQLNLYYECINPPSTTTTTTMTTKKTTTTTTTKKPTTMTTTKKPTTTTTTKKPTTMTTTTITPVTPVTPVCGDMKFKCVNAYYYSKYVCKRRFYKKNCQQSCGICDNGDDEIQCGNFKDNPNFDCYNKAMMGHCTIQVYRKRYKMKKNCPKTCCDEGRLYF